MAALSRPSTMCERRHTRAPRRGFHNRTLRRSSAREFPFVVPPIPRRLHNLLTHSHHSKGADPRHDPPRQRFGRVQPVIQPILVDIATHCLRSASAAYPGLIMGTDATSMHWAPIGQPESTDTEHVVAADRLTSSKGASAIAQPSARRGERARSSSKGRSSNGTTPVTPCVQPRPRRAPAALNPPTPLTGRRTDALRLG